MNQVEEEGDKLNRRGPVQDLEKVDEVDFEAMNGSVRKKKRSRIREEMESQKPYALTEENLLKEAHPSLMPGMQALFEPLPSQTEYATNRKNFNKIVAEARISLEKENGEFVRTIPMLTIPEPMEMLVLNRNNDLIFPIKK